MILFIGHDASLTGAPKSLLYIIKHVKKRSDQEIVIILQRDGELMEEYQKLGRVFVWNKQIEGTPGLLKRIYNNFFNNNDSRQKKIINFLIKNKPDVIFNNTIVNGCILEKLSELGSLVISRIPDMNFSIKVFNTQGNSADLTFKHTHHIITPSLAAKQNLVKNHGVQAENVSVCYGSIPNYITEPGEKAQKMRKQLGIPDEAFVVVACGYPGWRKGSDLFMKVADIVVNENGNKDIHFIWVGGKQNLGWYIQMDCERDIFELNDNFHLTGEVINTKPYYALADMFLMTSREDPFPLVNLEAGAHGLPIVSFEKSGGTEEFVNKKCGFIVPYADTVSMAEKVLLVKNNPELKNDLSKGVIQQATPFLGDEKIESIYQVIGKYLNE